MMPTCEPLKKKKNPCVLIYIFSNLPVPTNSPMGQTERGRKEGNVFLTTHSTHFSYVRRMVFKGLLI